ncbi:MAG TPA: ABC transporter ATP-binding protein [Oscillospiraceae bacterium]|nr:ABC transporter ATP-binding protein [Oscillospiraceae bacterium]HPK34812.1 ABC transporter ATP-binding protein [Oscillospiraceae bacterium]HPR75862.1 ABC transporter ATP-binding protein [Oscillospiraceae bacterium]
MLQIRWMFKNLKGTLFRYITAHILNVIVALFVLVWPILTRYIVGNITAGTPDPESWLLPALALWMGLVLLRNTLNTTGVYLRESSTQTLIYNIKMRIFKNLTMLEGDFYSRMNAGDILTRVQGDLDVVGLNARSTMFTIVSTTLMFFASVIYFFTINWILTLCLLIILPFIYVTSRRFSKEMRPLYTVNRAKMTRLSEIAQENIDANKTVRAFAREDYEYDRFYGANQDYQEAALKANRNWLSIWPIPEFLSQFLTVIVLTIGGFLTIKGKMTVADLTAFTSLIWALATSIRSIGNFLNDFQNFFPSADKAMELYYTQPRIVSRADCVKPERFKGNISFENVTLKIHDTTIVQNLNFNIESGKTLAIVGETGSGKTTVVNLLARFFDATEGSVKIDGVDVRDYNLQGLRKNIGMATQDVFLFSDTLDGNIAFGDPDMSEEQVKESAVRADADEFISKMEEGYDTIVGERGMGLSGGQRQRVALARAIAIKPAILVLDDTTSAVDMKTERYIWEQLQSLPYTCTKIIIAQRVSTVAEADEILVMQDGEITACGTHEELIRKPGFYRDIYEIQSQQTE